MFILQKFFVFWLDSDVYISDVKKSKKILIREKLEERGADPQKWCFNV